jgi:hypothetical protein
MNNDSTAIAEAVKSAPAAGVIAATVSGLTLQEWAALASLIWVLYLFGEKMWDRIIKPRLARRDGE